jgi:hypothetical protein
MTKNTFLAGVAAATMALFTACADDTPGGGSGRGKLVPAVELDASVEKPARSGDDARGGVPDVASLKLRMTSADGSYSREWESLADFGSEQEFKIGNYTFEAWYGTADSEGFDCAYYHGSEPVKIQDSKTTTVSLTASLKQAMVSVNYTEAFRNFMTAWSATVGSTVVVADETRPVYVVPGETVVTIDFTKPNGLKGNDYEVARFQAMAKTHYTVTVDVNNGEVGDAMLVITYDEGMETVTHTIDISDLVMNAPAPEVVVSGFTPGTAVEFVEGIPAADKLIMNIFAQGKIASVDLTTTSESLHAHGWPAHVNLANATESEKSVLESFGLVTKGLSGNIDEIAQLDFSEVCRYISEKTDNTTRFSLVVRDRNSKSSEAVELLLLLKPLQLEITGTAAYCPGEPLAVNMAYNGIASSEYLNVEYKNERATWTKVPVVEFGPATADAESSVSLVLSGIPADIERVTLRAGVGTRYSNEYTAAPAPFVPVVPENDVFTDHAMVTVEGTEDGMDNAVLVGKAEYYLSTEGGSYTKANGNAEGDYLHLTGLEPGTTYKVKVLIDGVFSMARSFTTESAAQLPNSDMEQWGEAGKDSKWTNWFLGESENGTCWGTNNPMTTSSGINAGYTRISGTQPTDDSRSGKAALIQTVGWGAGNTNLGNFSVVNKIDAGLLHLGSSRTSRPAGYDGREGAITTDDLECGLAFASRPSELTFWYKYSPKNSADRGYAEFTVFDADGNAIASANVSLEAADTYTQARLPVAYERGAAKAAKVYVKFLSTSDRAFLSKNSNNISYGSNHLGSKLYIDDIKLNY